MSDTVYSNHSEETPIGSVAMSIWEPTARNIGTALLKAGYPVGFFNRSVCGILVDSQNIAGVERIYQIKGESRIGKVMPAVFESPRLVDMIDETRIAPDFCRIVLNARELTSRIGSLCFLRVPITQDAANELPAIMVSRTSDNIPCIQNWDPRGYTAVRLLFREAVKQGVRFLAGTSMNTSGHPEITYQEDGIAFARNHNIPLFLTETRQKQIAQGSYPIISIDQTGVKVIRHGFFPSELFRILLSCEDIDTGNAIQSKYPQMQVREELAITTNPYQLRNLLIEHLNGLSNNISEKSLF